MNNSKTKVALITGGSSDIAQATAEVLAHKGYTIVLTSKDPIKTSFDQITLDLTEDNAVEALTTYLDQKGYQIEVLVNCAAIGGATLENTSVAFLRKVLDVNTVGAFKLSQFVASALIEAKKTGSIINITTVHASIPNTDPAYSASKAALLAMTKSMALKLAPHGIRVNSVAPGAIAGGMNSQLSQSQIDHISKEIPMAHFGSPEDIAQTIAFLVSKEAKYITGQDIKVDGGLSLADSSYNR
jgi:NAD(P)-dependent dehydrogenase (short-subunit alcohol dehydrogenase family)